MANVVKDASVGLDFIGISSQALLGGNLNGYLRAERIKKIAIEIKETLKTEKTISIPEIMKMFNVSAIDAIDAVELLREKGLIKEVSPSI